MTESNKTFRRNYRDRGEIQVQPSSHQRTRYAGSCRDGDAACAGLDHLESHQCATSDDSRRGVWAMLTGLAFGILAEILCVRFSQGVHLSVTPVIRFGGIAFASIPGTFPTKRIPYRSIFYLLAVLSGFAQKGSVLAK